MGKIAFIFPGQGSQYVGMGTDFYQHFSSAKKIFDMAGDQIKDLCFNGPQELLNITVNAQPCLFAADLASAAALNESGIYAEGAAGFSLGEIPALAYCGFLSQEEAFALVCLRAQAMQECAQRNKGGMLAVLGLSPEKVTEICAETSGVWPANFNCEDQTVVACAEDNIKQIQKIFASHGGKSVRLAVSGAFHSPFMDQAEEKMREYLQSAVFSENTIPLYSNVTAQPYKTAQLCETAQLYKATQFCETAQPCETPPKLIAAQVNSPVKWQKTIENMIADGFDTFIEPGPGKTLSGLVKKINQNVRAFPVCDMATLENALRQLV